MTGMEVLDPTGPFLHLNSQIPIPLLCYNKLFMVYSTGSNIQKNYVKAMTELRVSYSHSDLTMMTELLTFTSAVFTS